MNINEIWKTVLDHLSNRISQTKVDTWLKPTEIVSLNKEEVVISVPNKFFQNWITDNYEDFIKEELKKITGKEMKILYTIKKEKVKKENKEKEGIEIKSRNLFNPKYTFENFVVGPGNQFAHASCLAVAEKPGKVYNPLFIYGGVGLGKTHLLHAIGNKIVLDGRKLKVIYTSAEKFMNELIDCIKSDRMPEFRKKYRNADVLLIDDIQFIAGKKQTQEEFFHTFNELHNEGKQIVISSDKPPSELDHIEERLKSRFRWGLIADIQPPDLETRIAILKKKAEAEKIELPDEVAYVIAKRIKTNVRELEGCLIKISAMASLMNRKIDVDLALSILNNLYPATDDTLSPDSIIKLVSEEFGVKVSDIKSKRRTKNILRPRQIAMYLIRKFTNLSYTEIAEIFGGMDHTSVMHSVKKVESLLKTDTNLGNIVENLERKIEF